MGIISSLFGQNAAEAAQQLMITNLKKGKTTDQIRAIDYFYSDGSVGCGCLHKGNNNNLTDQGYLDMVTQKLNGLGLKDRAIQKIGLDESEIREIDPINLSSFIFDDDVKVKVTSGSTAVSSQFAVTWIFFSATQIYTYKFIFDMFSDETWEITNDFFYSDITCFSTERDVKQVVETSAISGCLKSGENINSSTYTIDRFKIVVPGTDYTFSMRNSDTMEISLQAAKAMLREKKFNK